MQSMCFGVTNCAWPPSIILSRHHSRQPGFKQNQVGDFPPKNNKQQLSQVRSLCFPPIPSLQMNEFWVSPHCPASPPPFPQGVEQQKSPTLIQFEKPLNVTVSLCNPWQVGYGDWNSKNSLQVESIYKIHPRTLSC